MLPYPVDLVSAETGQEEVVGRSWQRLSPPSAHLENQVALVGRTRRRNKPANRSSPASRLLASGTGV